MKTGFDNDKYLKMQSEHIRERISNLAVSFLTTTMLPEFFRDLNRTVNCVC